MEISFLIVTKNRSQELEFTLQKVESLMDKNKHEILVFIDGCPETEKLLSKYSWVRWFSTPKSISASSARNALYKNALGTILVGLDDDAHPISANFIETIQNKFAENQHLGILAFKEIKGIFHSDTEIQSSEIKEEFLTNDFIGCGFAIKNEVYKKTNGFPLWIDIYGEEPCLALEVLDFGYQILYSNQVVVNHRIDIEKRKLQGKNYFRFERQLRNSFFIFLVYYKRPLVNIIQLMFHNFEKYVLWDFQYFKCYVRAVFYIITHFFKILKYRKPIKDETVQFIKTTKQLKY